MEEEEIVRGAQALAAGLRIGVTYVGVALLLLALCGLQLARVPVPGLGCWGSALLIAMPLTLGIETLLALVRRIRRG
jgi:hypothetical protein